VNEAEKTSHAQHQAVAGEGGAAAPPAATSHTPASDRASLVWGTEVPQSVPAAARAAKVARLDPAVVGFPLHVYVAASLARHDLRSSRAFEDQVRAMPQITAADNVAGKAEAVGEGLVATAHDDGAEEQGGTRRPARPRAPGRPGGDRPR
jgi:hypothetical protein